MNFFQFFLTQAVLSPPSSMNAYGLCLSRKLIQTQFASCRICALFMRKKADGLYGARHFHMDLGVTRSYCLD